MTARHYRIGDQVTVAGEPSPNGQGRKEPVAVLEGRVVAFSDLAGPRQKLWIRSAGNRIGMAVVDLGALAGGEPTGRICGPPVDVASADHLARLILEGRTVRLPVEVQLNTLATALLQAERSEEGETP